MRNTSSNNNIDSKLKNLSLEEQRKKYCYESGCYDCQFFIRTDSTVSGCSLGLEISESKRRRKEKIKNNDSDIKKYDKMEGFM